MNTNQAPQNPQAANQEEQTSFGMPARLFDGYDGGNAPPDEFLQQLLQSAPPEFRARAEQFAKERQAAGEQTEPA